MTNQNTPRTAECKNPHSHNLDLINGIPCCGQCGGTNIIPAHSTAPQESELPEDEVVTDYQWDDHTFTVGEDISELQQVAGKTVMLHRNFLKLKQESNDVYRKALATHQQQIERFAEWIDSKGFFMTAENTWRSAVKGHGSKYTTVELRQQFEKERGE